MLPVLGRDTASTATLGFQPGFIHVSKCVGVQRVRDPATGAVVTVPQGKNRFAVAGLLQSQQRAGAGADKETSATGVLSLRLFMFVPEVEPCVEDVFLEPPRAGRRRAWLAAADGDPRGIPGQAPDYWSVLVRRAPELDERV